MADKRISQLPLATGGSAPVSSDAIAIDGVSLGTRQTTFGNIADVINPPASQAEAEAGTNNVKRMTPLTTSQAIASKIGTAAGTVAAGDDSRITGAAQKSANLSDLANASTARGNLGLGGAATLNVGTSSGTVAAGDDSRILAGADASARFGKVTFAIAASAMASLDVTKNDSAYLCTNGCEGVFTRFLVSSLTGDQLAARAVDTYQTIFINSTNNAAHVWVRNFSGPIMATWGGVVADGVNDYSARLIAVGNLAAKLSPLYRGAAKVELPSGVIIATFLYNPTPDASGDLTAFTMYGQGKDVTTLRRPSGSSSDVVTINTSTPTAYFGTISIGHMTIDGYNGTTKGLVLNEVWYSDFPSLRITNCSVGADLESAIYINFRDFDFKDNGKSMVVNKLAAPSFAGAVPAVINLSDGLMRFSQSTHLDVDWVNSVNITNCGFEMGNQSNASVPGAIKVGANCDRLSRVSTVLNMRGGWSEQNYGTSHIELGSGHNVIEGVRFWEPSDATYTIEIKGGRYSLRDLTSSTTKSPNIMEQSGALTGNLIINCPTLARTINPAKTGVDDGPSLSKKFITVGGPTSSGEGLVWQNSLTNWTARLDPVTGSWKLFIGGTLYLEITTSGSIITPIANMPNYANDAAAATGGVPVGGRYRNGSVQMIRVT